MILISANPPAAACLKKAEKGTKKSSFPQILIVSAH
jgi:hypothetical protein|tara:strand:+ start:65 stop:172 length:108 start_codon:yes stop_codon:yes gene_type:complete